MVTHFIVLLLLINGSVTYCNHKVRAFSSEGMQVVSWVISSVAVYRIVNIKSIKFPWPLRAWWLCSFILLALLALSECNESKNILGTSSSISKINVGDNLRVRGDYDRVKDYRQYYVEDINICTIGCDPSSPCWCCHGRSRTSGCYDTKNECEKNCV